MQHLKRDSGECDLESQLNSHFVLVQTNSLPIKDTRVPTFSDVQVLVKSEIAHLSSY